MNWKPMKLACSYRTMTMSLWVPLCLLHCYQQQQPAAGDCRPESCCYVQLNYQLLKWFPLVINQGMVMDFLSICFWEMYHLQSALRNGCQHTTLIPFLQKSLPLINNRDTSSRVITWHILHPGSTPITLMQLWTGHLGSSTHWRQHRRQNPPLQMYCRLVSSTVFWSLWTISEIGAKVGRFHKANYSLW